MKIERWIKLKYMGGGKRERYIRRQGRERERQEEGDRLTEEIKLTGDSQTWRQRFCFEIQRMIGRWRRCWQRRGGWEGEKRLRGEVGRKSTVLS